MFRRIAPFLVLAACLVSACKNTGELTNPFVKEKPFEPTAIPADFAIVVDENHDTFAARRHIQQVITAADSMSRTTYTTYRDPDNLITRRFTQETPLTPSQIQAMWNDVSRHNLLRGSSIWVNWRSDADIYKRNSYTIQIRAGGMERTYRQTNGFSGVLRPLMLLVDAVRLPITRDADVPVIIPGNADADPAPQTQ